MRVDLFDFSLPAERIADRPAVPRDAARLLEVTAEGRFIDRHVRDLPALLQTGDVLVVNDTKVIPARLQGRRGLARIEILLHRREGPDQWRVFARPARRLAVGQQIAFDPSTPESLTATVVALFTGGEGVLRFDRGGADLLAAFARHGHVPLPPYIRRPDDARDRDDYQTVFARTDGAVAAPTAGLHFTDAVLSALDGRGVERVAVTLHVGAGTFLPVRAQETCDHIMHVEAGCVTAAAAAAINRRRGRIVAVGTTSLRLLESAAAPDGMVHPFATETALFITPGHAFRTADLLLTNFHLPRSTLFMLVAAFAGLERMRAAYAHALATGYRFYSYGDACLLHRDSDDTGNAPKTYAMPR
ncbi:MAG: S-adenosylmethionine:tRNA ribosyltransferase-isomerase [Rhodospirillaceae bacterium]|nr:MAG: S-adenosylmethionine:tRNA ribosyltransferase-isomerase [Rhodospirillaceae bacterium]